MTILFQNVECSCLSMCNGPRSDWSPWSVMRLAVACYPSLYRRNGLRKSDSGKIGVGGLDARQMVVRE